MEKLLELLRSQLEVGGYEDAIQAMTLKMIDNFSDDTPDEIQNLIYELNMHDVNDLQIQDYRRILMDLTRLTSK